MFRVRAKEADSKKWCMLLASTNLHHGVVGLLKLMAKSDRFCNWFVRACLPTFTSTYVLNIEIVIKKEKITLKYSVIIHLIRIIC